MILGVFAEHYSHKNVLFTSTTCIVTYAAGVLMAMFMSNAKAVTGEAGYVIDSTHTRKESLFWLLFQFWFRVIGNSGF
jgi:hypothetical protein